MRRTEYFFTMILRYSDIEWNDEPVVWYITCRSIVLTSPGEEFEKPEVHEADEEVQGMCDDVSIVRIWTIKNNCARIWYHNNLAFPTCNFFFDCYINRNTNAAGIDIYFLFKFKML